MITRLTVIDTADRWLQLTAYSDRNGCQLYIPQTVNDTADNDRHNCQLYTELTVTDIADSDRYSCQL